MARRPGRSELSALRQSRLAQSLRGRLLPSDVVDQYLPAKPEARRDVPVLTAREPR
jgi:hypothetical protein